MKLLVPSFHRNVPQIVSDVLRSAMRGSVNVILSISHYTQHSRYDSQRQHRFHPSQVHLSSSFSSSNSLSITHHSTFLHPFAKPKPCKPGKSQPSIIYSLQTLLPTLPTTTSQPSKTTFPHFSSKDSPPNYMATTTTPPPMISALNHHASAATPPLMRLMNTNSLSSTRGSTGE